MKRFLLLACLPALAACNSYKFADRSDVNIAIPPYYSEREFYKKGAEAIGNNLEQIAGRVMYLDPARGGYRLSPYRVISNNGTAVVEAIQDANVYTSVINQGYQANANFPFVTASSTEGLVKEYEIRDVARARVLPTMIPSPTDVRARMGNEVAATATVYWVEGATLTAIRERGYRSIESGGAVSGTGFGADGKVYGSRDATTNTYVISLLLIEMPPPGQLAPTASPPFGQGYTRKLPKQQDGLSRILE